MMFFRIFFGIEGFVDLNYLIFVRVRFDLSWCGELCVCGDVVEVFYCLFYCRCDDDD